MVYRERTKSRSYEIAEKTAFEKYTLDWSQSKVFLVIIINAKKLTSLKLGVRTTG